ncbi:hypothetical protein APHAL10511_008185 [Amanita phalloides]|nr:hypothetical protein APHAL10511_008185 [Amanita phalloides]
MTILHGILQAIVKIGIRVLRTFSPSVDSLLKRLEETPGIPVSNPSISYWQIPPSSISDYGSEASVRLPERADIVILGSGITGTAFARTILKEKNRGQALKVIMLEARGACSGATGRNGGHIAPVSYSDYGELKGEHGIEVAKEIIRFRLAHLPEILKVAAEDNLIDESQCREVEVFDVYCDAGLYGQAKTMLSGYQEDMPSEGSSFRIHEGTETIKRLSLQLDEKVVGCLSTRGGALHPYRFVTGILRRLLEAHPEEFSLFTHTPCTAIKTSTGGGYRVMTHKGIIETGHVVHATNAWASHLLPGMRGRILPLRGVMSAQIPRAGPGKRSWNSSRSFTFYPAKSMLELDYLTQQLADLEGDGALMVGGGIVRTKGWINELGNVDDSGWNPEMARYLGGVLEGYFEGSEAERETTAWGGLIGMSTDGQPWVGRVPEFVSGRASGAGAGGVGGLAAPGEWVAAGYSGEGMVHGWLSGCGVARQVSGGAGMEGQMYKVGRERWAGAGVAEAAVRVYGARVRKTENK